MERLQHWFGTPLAAAKTLIWLCWVSFLVSILVGVLMLVAWGLQAVFT